MEDIFSAVADILKKGEDLALIRIVSDKGSTPRSAGAMMVISRSRQIVGTIGGGMVDATAIKKGMEVFENTCSAVSLIDMSAKEAAGADMICGGMLEFLCEYIPSNNHTIHVFDSIRAIQKECRRHILCTEFNKDGECLKALRRFLLKDGDTNQEFSISPDLQSRLWDTGKTLAGSAMVVINGRKYCIDVLENNDSLFIFGAGHVAKEVAALAINVGFRAVVLDDREEFANEKRFPAPAEIIVLDSFNDCFENFAIDENSYVVIVTRGHMHDKNVLEQALRTSAGYIGMIGSKKKRNAIYKTLLSGGFTDEDLKRVQSPIGLPIDTDTPEEIAVSIVGQLIHSRSKKK
ncbi:MAG: XdhC family protein [Deltaproteobacteria bacterium]|nr:XdhC family protein [Deltaproteobacteria bacterium]